MFYSYIVLLIYLNKTMYLLGNLLFFKTHVNHFIARGDPSCANVISKWMLQVGPGATLSFEAFSSSNWQHTSRYITTSRYIVWGHSFYPSFWCLCQKLSLPPLYLKKILLHKSSERSSLVTGPGLNFSPPKVKNLSVFHGSATFPPLE